MTIVAPGLVPLAALRFTGTDLRRPECVLCAANGDVYAADWRGGVTRIGTDGAQQTVVGAHPDGGPLQPNGIALAKPVCGGPALVTVVPAHDSAVADLTTLPTLLVPPAGSVTMLESSAPPKPTRP